MGWDRLHDESMTIVQREMMYPRPEILYANRSIPFRLLTALPFDFDFRDLPLLPKR